MTHIHATALVDARAELASDVTVGAYTVIGPHVRIGAGSSVGPHAVIEGHTTIGRDNAIFQFASIGAAPQDMKYRGEPTRLEIGDRNTLREFVTINTGTVQDDGVTRIGDDNWIMAYVHVAHDVRLGNHCVLANNATLAGHVHVGDWATIGGLSGVHQFVKIGAQAMVGFQAHVAQDVPPYMTVDGHPLAVRAVNLTGLKRRNFSDTQIATIRQMHRLLYRSALPLAQAIEQIGALKAAADEASQADIQAMLDFLAAATRGIVR
ncbi:acyl-ACP--UDP-N-acetylglucosamine O-acyltransferase [Aquabacterium sp. OR-4]|uniref:acyl-ACP--UDP-N-acetylglucosamine O-acyltransferase n=1 Tax=Aquabacterium sp. OR-4 TaxID=2978127 RepID=UPI0021B2D33D|nr:acyl-ACP--UDP-N-acetylglucosamine O-acyltransferase [Aquabacterium sp. OR-4]MDT7835450.1 acyl-ACP--UDP-N-acetylglucosamine O-acyltransferase [Aquabacterium sp. OR-4]